MKVYQLKSVLEATGLPEWKALNMVKSGLIRPSVSDPDGPGTRRLYSKEDLFKFAVAASLFNAELKKLKIDLLLAGGATTFDGRDPFHEGYAVLKPEEKFLLPLFSEIPEAIVRWETSTLLFCDRGYLVKMIDKLDGASLTVIDFGSFWGKVLKAL